MPKVVALLFFCLLVVACGDDKQRERAPMTFKAASGKLTVPGALSGEVRLQPARDDTVLLGPANSDEETISLEVMMRSSDGEVWLQLNLFDVQQGRVYDDFRPEGGDGRVTVLLGRICDGSMGKLLDDACAWYSSDFIVARCSATLTAVSDSGIDGSFECSGLGANCAPDSTGQRDAAGVCNDRLRRPLLSLNGSFELAEAVDTLSGASRSPRSLLR